MDTSLPVQRIDAQVCVAPQLQPQAMAEAARAGFRSIVNNRPDFEGGADQPTSAQLEAAARAAGLEYRHLPVNGAFQTPEQIAAFAAMAAQLPRPLLMFCRSGARSTKLYLAARELG